MTLARRIELAKRVDAVYGAGPDARALILAAEAVTGTIDLSSHVPGSGYRYRHGWIPLAGKLTAQQAAQHRVAVKHKLRQIPASGGSVTLPLGTKVERMKNGNHIVGGHNVGPDKQAAAEVAAAAERVKAKRAARKTAKKGAGPLDEVVNFGGVPTKLGSVISQLQKEGHPQAYIDRYVQGLAAGKRARAKR